MDNEQFYDKYKQHLRQEGTFPSEAQLAEASEPGDDSARDNTVDD
ncbi:hypothetical protein ACWGMA_08105 [Streptomyces asiaticus]